MTSASLALALLTLLTPSSGRASEDFDRPQYICMNKGFPGESEMDARARPRSASRVSCSCAQDCASLPPRHTTPPRTASNPPQVAG